MDDRIERLLDAVLDISRDLDLETILDRITKAACELVDARYGALGVIDEERGGLSAFVFHGVDPAAADEIGGLPAGHGVLGLLIRDPRPIRLENLADHPTSHGMPAGHPQMSSFLGVPLLVRDEVFGNLYLAEKRGGVPFTDEDEQLVVGLAAIAGAAIANARLYDTLRSRHAWRDAAMELASSMLAGATTEDVPTLVSRLANRMLDADAACVVVPYDDGVWVLGSVGDAPSMGFLAGDEARGALETLTGDDDVADPDELVVAFQPGPDAGRDDADSLGWLWQPISEGEAIVAAIGVGRDESFTDRDRQLLESFAGQASVAWSFERAQSQLHRLSIVEDRERIGRDLHDTVIQRLFAAGLTLQGTIRRHEDDPGLAERLTGVVSEIDQTVKEIRSTIFALQAAGDSSRGVRSDVLDVVKDVAAVFPRPPRIRFDGPIDTAVSPAVRGQLLPVVRELLTNVAKHADATDVELELSVVRGVLQLRVQDDGRGIDPAAAGGFGLVNLRRRAEDLGGQMEIGPGRDGHGTLVEWRVPA